MPVSKGSYRQKDMKIRLDFLIYSVLALTGPAMAQSVMNLQEHRQTLLYAFIGLSALLFILILWEIIDMMSKRERVPITKPQVSVIGEMEESSPEEEDPIKALLKKQAEVISTKEEEEELPAFLRESPSTVEDLANREEPPPGMPVMVEKAAPVRSVESSPDSDPFKALLMKSAQKEEAPHQEARDENVEPTIPLAKIKGKVMKKEEEDPFKSLLKSKREEKVAPKPVEEEPVSPIKRSIPMQESPSPSVGIPSVGSPSIGLPSMGSPSQPAIGQPSGVEVKVPKIKGLKPPQKTEDKKVSLAPPQSETGKDQEKEKKISFSLPGKKKSRSVGRLFSRLSEAKKSEEESLAAAKASSGIIKPDVTPEKPSLEVMLQGKKSESSPGVPAQNKVMIKLPEKPPVLQKPDKPKVIELDIEGKKAAGSAEKPESGGQITFRPTQKKVSPIPPTKRLSLSLPTAGGGEPIKMKPKSSESRNPMDTNSLQIQSHGQSQPQKDKEQERTKPRPQPTKIFRQIPKPASTKMLNPGLSSRESDDSGE